MKKHRGPFRRLSLVTVAIPCYNAEKYLPSLLAAVLKQTHMPDEILVIDDGSGDHTVEVARQYPVKVIEHSVNKGLACARNSAIHHANGDVIVFFDADTLPDRKNLERMLNEYKDPNIAGVGGQEFFFKAPRKIDLWRNLFWRQTHGPGRIDSAWMLMGLCASYKREILIDAGGFDEKYRTNGEDVDMGLRLTRSGYRQIYVPEIGVFHRRKDTLKSILSLAYRHSYWQSRSFRTNGVDPLFQLKEAVRWLFVSTGSSMLRHKDPVFALLSSTVCVSAIAGRLAEQASWKRR